MTASKNHDTEANLLGRSHSAANLLSSMGSTTPSTNAEQTQALELDLISKITQQKPKSSINPEGKIIWPMVDRLENMGAIRPAENSAKQVRMKIDKLAKAFKFTEKAMSKVAESLVKWPKDIDACEFEKFSNDMACLLKAQSAQFEALRVQMEFISMGFKSCSHEEKAKACTLYRINKLTKNLEQIRKKHIISEDYKTVQKDLIDADTTLQRQKYRLRQNANYELRKHYLNYVTTLERSSKNVRESCDVFFTNASQIEFDDNLESCANQSLQHHQNKLRMIQNTPKEKSRPTYERFPSPINESALNVQLHQRKNGLPKPAGNLKSHHDAHSNLTKAMNHMSLCEQNILVKEEDENTVNPEDTTEEPLKTYASVGDKTRTTMINLSPQKRPGVEILDTKIQNFKLKTNQYNNDVSVDPQTLWGHFSG